MFTNTGPRLDGHLHPDFQAMSGLLSKLIAGYAGGAAVCVYHRGECVVDLWGGERDEQGRPWEQDTLAPSFSTTKGVASTLVHIMVDRGVLDYDQRVAEVWPEFAQGGKGEITLRHVLAHQSGLYHIRQMIDHADRMLDWEYMIRAIERTCPVHRPGLRTGYHGLTYGFLVGEILQRATGRSFADLVHEELVVPLQLDGMYVGAPEEALPRAAELLWPATTQLWSSVAQSSGWKIIGNVIDQASWAVRDAAGLVGMHVDPGSIVDALAPRGIGTFDFGAPETLRVSIPAANGLFTARSLAKMYAALAGGGEIDGVRLLSRETLERATELQEPTPGRAVLPFDMRWRLGYHGVATTRGVPSRAYGHFGFGGSGAWADPRRELAVALIVNRGMGTPFGDTRIVRVGGAALACESRRRGWSRRGASAPIAGAAPTSP